MGQMVLNAVKFCAENFTWEGSLQQNGDRGARAAIAEPTKHQIDVGAFK